MTQKFRRRAYITTIIILTTVFALSNIGAVIFTQSFFSKYSYDGSLKETTINNIKNLRSVSAIIAIISGLIVLSLIIKKNASEEFIEKNEKTIRIIIKVLIMIIIILIIGEIIARATLKEETIRAGRGPGARQFSKEAYRINNEGMRDYNHNLTAVPGTIRIAGIGKSFTYGYGMQNANKTYLRVLEKELNEKDGKYEVFNFGVLQGNFTTDIELLRTNITRYKPKYVILAYTLWDFENIDPEIKEPPILKKTEIPIIGFWLERVSYLVYFTHTRIDTLRARTGIAGNYEEFLKKKFNSTENIKHNEELFSELKTLGEREGFRIVLLIYPMMHKLEDYPFIEAHETIKVLAERQGFSVMDALQRMEGANEKNFIIDSYETHANEKGHRIAAEEFEKYFRKVES